MIELVMTKTNLESLERQRRNIEVRSKLSRLPHKKTLQEFNVLFQPSIDEKFVKELVTMAFVYRAENIVLLGLPARAIMESCCLCKASHKGKTHLAVGLPHGGTLVVFLCTLLPLLG